MRVGVIGSGGRMGSTVCAAVNGAGDMELVATVDLDDDLESLSSNGVEVAVDFTVAAAAVENAEWCASHGIHAVIGTSAVDQNRLAAAFPADKGIGCVLAPNFAIGAVLMMRFAEMAAPWFDTAEIVELHHDRKVDSPSGTALQTAARMAAASHDWAADPTEVENLAGARGAVGPDGIRIHSVRLRGLVAHQEVLLGAAGQSLTIRHDSYDRESFMPGVLLAVREVGRRPGLTIGLDALLGL